MESTAKLIFTPLDNAIPLFGNNLFHWTHEVKIKNSKNLKSFENGKAKGFCLNNGTFSAGKFKPGDLKCARDYEGIDLGLDILMGKKNLKNQMRLYSISGYIPFHWLKHMENYFLKRADRKKDWLETTSRLDGKSSLLNGENVSLFKTISRAI